MADKFHSSPMRKRKGPQYSADNCDLMVVLKDPLKTDSYATLMGKVIAQVAIDSADFAFSDVSNDVRMTVTGATDIVPSEAVADTVDLCLGLVYTGNSEVTEWTDATDRVITNEAGDTITIPNMIVWVRDLAAVA